MYHVNPESGDIGVCKAKKGNCPWDKGEFRDLFHFGSKTEAKDCAEALMARKPLGGHLVVYMGLPGSGKSTLAEALAQETGGVILNRDDKRTELAGEEYHKGPLQGKVEAAVTAILNNKLHSILSKGGTAIDSNTNLNPRSLGYLISQAKATGSTIEFRPVDVPLEVALERNRARGAAGGRLVPPEVIEAMARKAYGPDGRLKEVLVTPKGMVNLVAHRTAGMELLETYNTTLEERYPLQGKEIVIVDIDGTLVDNRKAAEKFLQGRKRDYQGFYRESARADFIPSTLELLDKLRAGGLTIFAMTGRTDDAASVTIELLERQPIPISRLIMGREGDFRGDNVLKTENFAKLRSEGFTVVHAIDDRPTSVAVWEEAGVRVSKLPWREELQEGQVPVVTTDIGSACIRCGKPLSGAFLHQECRP